jgi:hypothetical protein
MSYTTITRVGTYIDALVVGGRSRLVRVRIVLTRRKLFAPPAACSELALRRASDIAISIDARSAGKAPLTRRSPALLTDTRTREARARVAASGRCMDARPSGLR